MTKYVIQRLVLLIPVLLGVSLLTFAIIQITPGDPVRLMLGDNATPETVENMRREFGLDQPLAAQYVNYVWNAVRGDLGKSFRGRTPVLDEILARFPSTFQLTAAAMLLAIFMGVSAGVIAATARRKLWDALTMIIATMGLSVPSFWIGIILLIIFGVQLRLVSVTGGDGPLELFLAAFVLSLNSAAFLARLTRSSILEVVGMDFVRTAYAKGLSDRMVTIRHVLRNALIPVVTVIGLQAGFMLGGAVFIEAVFARPGLGRFAVNAIQNRDYPQIQGIVLFAATIYVLVNLSIDLMYAAIDPRIRYD